MKCAICRAGDTVEGLATFTYERSGRVIVIRNVPAQVCGTCGEAYYSEDTTEKLLNEANALLANGVEVAVADYVAA